MVVSEEPPLSQSAAHLQSSAEEAPGAEFQAGAHEPAAAAGCLVVRLQLMLHIQRSHISTAHACAPNQRWLGAAEAGL